MQTVTLIIDKRREIPVKYKKLLENEYSAVFLSKNFISAMKFIQDKEPDLIIISDSTGQDLGEFCKEIRAITYSMRPIIVATSKSSDLSDRLKVLESGADDFISEPINSKEFVVRIQAHLRREFESNLDDRKMIPNRNYSMRAIKRLISEKKQKAALLVSIDNFQNYREAYTKLASDKLAQTYTAIITSTLSGEDFIGSLSENEFLVITDEINAEKLANFLVFAFDTVSEKFYSSSDISRGFVMTQGDSQPGMRSEFVHTTVGIVPVSGKYYDDTNEVLSDLINIHSLAKLPSKSNYLMERTKISAADAVSKRDYNNRILIIEKDDSMKLLLSTVLNLQGYETKTISEFKQINTDYIPAVIVLDAGSNEERAGLDICRLIKESHMLYNTKVVVTSVFHEKETVLKSGADLYVPKPYEISDMIKWIEQLVKEVNF